MYELSLTKRRVETLRSSGGGLSLMAAGISKGDCIRWKELKVLK